MYIIIGIFVLVLGVAALYYILFFTRMIKSIRRFSNLKHPKVWAIIPSSLVLSGIFTMHGLRFLFGVYLFMIGLLLDVLIRVLGRYTKKAAQAFPRVRRIYRTGVITIVVTLIIMTLGYINIRDIRTTSYELSTTKSLPNEHLTIAMVSDLHLNNSINAKNWHPYIQKLQDMEPDVVVLVGDIFDEHTKESDLKQVAREFAEIESTYGTYFVLGNHEGYASTSTKVLQKAGIHVLLDECVQLDETVTLMGRKDASSANRLPIKNLMEGVSMDSFILELDHQPVDTDAARDEGVDLQLSGHTHDGQILLMKLFQPLIPMNDWNYGYMQKGNYQLIVSSGAGGWGFPYRSGSHSEIVKIVVRTKR